MKNVNFKQIADPIDIDDDISEDHAADSVAYQLRELEGMNKYMQNIRVPSSNILILPN